MFLGSEQEIHSFNSWLGSESRRFMCTKSVSWKQKRTQRQMCCKYVSSIIGRALYLIGTLPRLWSRRLGSSRPLDCFIRWKNLCYMLLRQRMQLPKSKTFRCCWVHFLICYPKIVNVRSETGRRWKIFSSRFIYPNSFNIRANKIHHLDQTYDSLIAPRHHYSSLQNANVYFL